MKCQGQSTVTLGRRISTVMVYSHHGFEMYVFVSNLTMYLYYKGNLIIGLEKWS